ncbi:valine--tRNA ligase [bacterium]|nr:valine--tRNA ligase [bacterium]
MSFPKRFAKEKETEIYRLWEEGGYFSPEKLPSHLGRKKPYVVMLPPPNITGSLHMGHALNATCQDIMVRYKRMKGYRTLWVPGIDHAGIATQNVVEKELLKEGKTRHDLGREKFLERIWQWKEKYGSIILEQLKKLGASCDWSRTTFTMDKDYQEAVRNAFLRYWRDGLIYRGERIINWCPRCETALSDIELEYQEEKSFLWYIAYPIKGSKEEIVVATTRPETMLGDTAVAVHPKDKRYRKLVGKKAILPLVNREIPIIADERVDPEFGTGAVKVTPAHDPLDYEIGKDHNLKFIKVINEKGRIIKPKKYAGLSVKEARKKVEEDLKKQGYLRKKESYTHSVAHCYRCGTTIEPLLSKQWFVKMKPLAKEAIKVVEEGKVKFVPSRYKKVYLEWMKNVKDWCISRQIWWGHRIPLKGEQDVLDTWFSSALWPFAALGWTGNKEKDAKNKDLKIYYPTTHLFTAKDIIYLWVARMIFSGLYFRKEIPFKKVYIHATILDPQGRRMSKSLGTGVDPLDLWEKYGADGVRFGLAIKAGYRQEIRFKEEDYVAGRNFATKIWNASRFLYLNLPHKIKEPTLGDLRNLSENQKKTLKLLLATAETIERELEKFRFDLALKAIYEFFWHHFCDKTIEEHKERLRKKDQEAIKFLVFVLLQSLKLLHPFMPFVTEGAFEKLRGKISLIYPVPLIVQPWPEIKEWKTLLE